MTRERGEGRRRTRRSRRTLRRAARPRAPAPRAARLCGRPRARRGRAGPARGGGAVARRLVWTSRTSAPPSWCSLYSQFARKRRGGGVACAPDERARAPGPAVGAEVALVRAQRAAVEPCADPLGVPAAGGVRALAGRGQRAGGVRRWPAGDRPARAAGAGRVADGAGASADPHRRRHVPQPRRDGRRRRAGRDRRALHARQRLLRHRRAATASTTPTRRSRGRASRARARRGSATTSGAARTSSSRAA